jgi:hypothetical protein
MPIYTESGGDALDVARGLRGGISDIDAFGHTEAAPNGTYGPVVHGGTLNWLATASAVRVKSGGNANDTVAGTRARKVMVYGLDETWTLAQEEIDLAGTSASSATTITFMRVYKVVVTEVGTVSSTNEADIEIETTGGTSLCLVDAGDSHSQMAVYTVPAGCTGYLRRVHLNVDGAKTVDARTLIRTNTADETAAPYGPVEVIGIRDGIVGHLEIVYEVMTKIPAMSDIWVEGRASAADVDVAAELDLFITNRVD